MVREIEIIFRDSEASNRNNKKLLSYFTNNLSLLNRNGLTFKWSIANNENIMRYKKRGITKFPAIYNSKKGAEYGVENIIQNIHQLLEYRNKNNTSRLLEDGLANVTPEAMHELQMRMLGNKDDTDRDNSDVSVSRTEELMRKSMEMIRNRQSAGLHDPSMGPSDDFDEPSPRSSNNRDDLDRFRVKFRANNVGGHPSSSINNMDVSNDESQMLHQLVEKSGNDIFDAF